HGCCSNKRAVKAEQAKCCCGNCCGVVEERKKEVLLDRAQCAACDINGFRHRTDARAWNHDVSRFDCDIGSRRQCDAKIGLREGGCIVDAITHHDNRRSLLISPCGL